jgi:hypothetical protein
MARAHLQDRLAAAREDQRRRASDPKPTTPTPAPQWRREHVREAYDQGFEAGKESTNTLGAVVMGLALGFIAGAAWRELFHWITG